MAFARTPAGPRITSDRFSSGTNLCRSLTKKVVSFYFLSKFYLEHSSWKFSKVHQCRLWYFWRLACKYRWISQFRACLSNWMKWDCSPLYPGQELHLVQAKCHHSCGECSERPRMEILDRELGKYCLKIDYFTVIMLNFTIDPVGFVWFE